MKFLSWIVGLWLVWAWAANAAPPDPSRYDGPDYGQLALTLSIPFGDRATLTIDRIDSPGRFTISRPGSFTTSGINALFGEKPDFDGQGLTGPPASSLGQGQYYDAPSTKHHRQYVRLTNLPPGDYRISAISIITPGSVSIFQNSLHENIPFKIEPGKLTYLGMFEWNGVQARGRIGLKVFQGWSLSVIDMSERDLSVLRARGGALGDVRLQVNGAVDGARWMH